jgi:hypothetical protein
MDHVRQQASGRGITFKDLAGRTVVASWIGALTIYRRSTVGNPLDPFRPRPPIPLTELQTAWLAYRFVGYRPEEVKALRAVYRPREEVVVLEVDLVGCDWEPTYEFDFDEVEPICGNYLRRRLNDCNT